MADSSVEGLEKASRYAAKEQAVVQQMQDESIVETKLRGVKTRDIKIRHWLRQHQVHGAVPYDAPRPLSPMIENLEAPDEANLLPPANALPP